MSVYLCIYLSVWPGYAGMQLKVNFIVARQCARRRTRPGKGCLKQAGRGGGVGLCKRMRGEG